MPILLLPVLLTPPLIFNTLATTSADTKLPDLTTLRTQLFKHSVYLTTVAPSLHRDYDIVRRAPEKTRSALANITSIERILMAI